MYELALQENEFLSIIWETSFSELSNKPKLELIPSNDAESEHKNSDENIICEKVRILSRWVIHFQKKRGPTVVDGAYESWEMVSWSVGLRLIKGPTLSDDGWLNHGAYDS